MVNKIVREIQASKRRTIELRKIRDDVAHTLREAGYTSTDMAEKVTVQRSRVRQYVTAGEPMQGVNSVKDFEDAFHAWEYEDARLMRLRETRNAMILEELATGRFQTDVAAEFGVSQFQVSHITRHNTAVTLL